MRIRVWMASLTGLLMVGIVGLTPARAVAVDFEVQNTFEDAVYGAGIGALVGLGAMLVSGKPTDHWNYLLVGTGVGIIAGAAYGTYTGARAVATYEDGKLKLGMPSMKLASRADKQGRARLALGADLFRSRF